MIDAKKNACIGVKWKFYKYFIICFLFYFLTYQITPFHSQHFSLFIPLKTNIMLMFFNKYIMAGIEMVIAQHNTQLYEEMPFHF